jgi:hypothetical protein
VVASIWGFNVDDYAKAAAMLADVPGAVVAVECNVSCPNIEDRRRMFAHSTAGTAEAVGAAVEGLGGRLPLWAKLSPNVTDITEIAGAALGAGAAALTLVNTVMGMAIDPETRRFRLGAGGGGLSGPAIHPVAVRAVYECRAAHPDATIVGVGGISTAADAVELMLAGADGFGRASGGVGEHSPAVLDVRAADVALHGDDRAGHVGQHGGGLGIVVDAEAPDAGHHTRAGGDQSGQLELAPRLHAGVLQADAVQHAGTDLVHARGRIPGPRGGRERLHHHRADLAEVEVSRQLRPVTRRPRRQHHRVRQAHRPDVDREINGAPAELCSLDAV